VISVSPEGKGLTTMKRYSKVEIVKTIAKESKEINSFLFFIGSKLKVINILECNIVVGIC
jgi:hypothetical protein